VNVKICGTQIYLLIWDTADQKIHHGITAQYYANGKIAFIVLIQEQNQLWIL
jgi:hypothetical protein